MTTRLRVVDRLRAQIARWHAHHLRAHMITATKSVTWCVVHLSALATMSNNCVRWPVNNRVSVVLRKHLGILLVSIKLVDLWLLVNVVHRLHLGQRIKLSGLGQAFFGVSIGF